MPHAFYHREKSPWYPLNRRLGGPHGWTGGFGEGIYIYIYIYIYTYTYTHTHLLSLSQI